MAPGGTENVDEEIYEAVVSQPITDAGVGGTFFVTYVVGRLLLAEKL